MVGALRPSPMQMSFTYITWKPNEKKGWVWNTQQVQLETFEQLNMEQYIDNLTFKWKSETEYWNLPSGLAHKLTVLTKLYRSSHLGQSLTGRTWRVAIGLAHKQTVLTELYSN